MWSPFPLCLLDFCPNLATFVFLCNYLSTCYLPSLSGCCSRVASRGLRDGERLSSLCTSSSPRGSRLLISHSPTVNLHPSFRPLCLFFFFFSLSLHLESQRFVLWGSVAEQSWMSYIFQAATHNYP